MNGDEVPQPPQWAIPRGLADLVRHPGSRSGRAHGYDLPRAAGCHGCCGPGVEPYLDPAARAAVPAEEAEGVRRRERDWQGVQLPGVIRELVLDDQRRRNGICWNVFDD